MKLVATQARARAAQPETTEAHTTKPKATAPKQSAPAKAATRAAKPKAKASTKARATTKAKPRARAAGRIAAPRPAAKAEAQSPAQAAPAAPDRTPLRKDDLPKPLHTGKRLMGRVQLVLDEGQTTDVLGICYGLEHEVSAPGYRVKLFLDYYNRRLKVMDYRAQDYGAMVAKLRFLADANKFDKVWIKADEKDWQHFLRYGYVLEGLLKYANRGRTAYMMSRFCSQQRLHSRDLMQEILLIEEILGRGRREGPRPLPAGYTLDFARERDVDGMLGLYRRVFKTYPSPLTYREYLTAVLHRDALFRVIRNKSGQVVSVASAEFDRPHLSAELTDCATHPDERGKGLMSVILHALENDLRKHGYICAYTMARARSYGMNAAFHALGYEFNGRMINNCDIYGAFEDMNLWVKDLRPERVRGKKAKPARA
ncbi:putative beta-lysine N-acetyltransferase [Vulgatibacter sp.]|uniref:putative beta-lysine N-acetyltransferase n=1 Tax=Vulgatibacter sp. TaxID=1971226 RepID=UPI00356443D5